MREFRGIRKIKPIYMVGAFILLMPISYVAFKQYTVKSCQRYANDENKKANEMYKKETYREGSLSQQVLYYETAYTACMRSKGFSN